MLAEKLREQARNEGYERNERNERIKDEGINSFNSFNSYEENIEFTPPSWPILPEKALYGFAGEFVELAARQSEADPAAILATFLTRFSAEVGSAPYMMVGDASHRARISAVIVGDSSKGRKGTSCKPVERLFSAIQTSAKTSPGPFSSGEGIIYAVRDAVKKWDDKNRVYVDVDPGVTDKRLFVMDEEFAGVMANTKREGNTLSMVIRQAWDNGNFDPITKTSKITATKAHVAWVSHITKNELHRKLAESEAFNGFANRILWVCATRKQEIPWPQPMNIHELSKIQQKLINTLPLYGGQSFEVKPSQTVREEWVKCYHNLTKDKPGLVGCITNRAEAQVLRLAMIYALTDGSRVIEIQHLDAAMALWKYCEQSARYIFHGMQTDTTAQRILEALKEKTLSSTEIHKLFGNNYSKERIEIALSELQTAGVVEKEVIKRDGPGRPETIWKYIYANERN